ncbi:MAG: hypothetical protein V9H69_02975 [Anaerolineae bacterium]|jgi:hypothetical protein
MKLDLTLHRVVLLVALVVALGALTACAAGSRQPQLQIRLQNDTGMDIEHFWLGAGSGDGGPGSRSFGAIADGQATPYRRIKPVFGLYVKYNYIAEDGRRYLGSTFPRELLGQIELEPGNYTFILTLVDGESVVTVIRDDASYRTDVAGLSKIIALPEQPEQVWWQFAPIGSGGRLAVGPTDYELVAVLQYDLDALQALQDRLEPQTSPAELFVAPDFVRDWFPDPLREAFVADPAFPDTPRLTATRYQPDLFVKGGLLHGFVVVVDDYVLVYLYTM